MTSSTLRPAKWFPVCLSEIRFRRADRQTGKRVHRISGGFQVADANGTCAAKRAVAHSQRSTHVVVWQGEGAEEQHDRVAAADANDLMGQLQEIWEDYDAHGEDHASTVSRGALPLIIKRNAPFKVVFSRGVHGIQRLTWSNHRLVTWHPRQRCCKLLGEDSERILPRRWDHAEGASNASRNSS